VIAAHRKQARLIIRYMAAMLEHIPMLQEMVEAPRADGFDLNNQVTIEVGVASFRSTRGYAYAGVLADEIAYWRTDEHSAEPDEEVLAAIRPGMAQIPGSMLICASSPYARQGTLWNAYRKYWGDAEAPLVWKATTREMNPTFPQATVNKALADDYAKASAEYLAEFRSDVEGFVTLEVVEGCVINGVIERGPISGVSYEAFCDPSGGSSDSFTLAVGHRDGDRVVVDAVRERIPPFSPEQVVDEFAATLRRYGVHNVSGDRYGGDFPRELFRKRNISYELAEQTCSDNFRDLLPLLNSETIELLDSPRLLSQLVGLERRTSRSGRDQISHRPSAHDDVAASVAGLARMLARTSTYTLDHVV
jgi:hypothetical protein